MKRTGAVMLFAVLLCLSAQTLSSAQAAPGGQMASYEYEQLRAPALSEDQPISSDIAKQLLTPGWENPSSSKSVSVVVYTVNLIELDSSTTDRLEFGFEAARGVDDGVWDVSFDHAIIRLLREASDAFHPKISGSHEDQDRTAGYQSWLVTLDERPVEVLIQETAVFPAVRGRERDSEFRLRLTPQHADAVNDAVMTELELDLLTSAGGVGRAKSSVLVGTEPQPVAVVKRTIAASGESEYQYFAMYVSANVVSSAQLPRDAALLPIGSIGGLQQLFEVGPSESALLVRQWKLSLAGGHDLQLGVDCDLPLSSKHSLRGSLELSEKGIAGYADVSVEVHDRLGIMVQLDNRGRGGSPLVRLGLIDETVLGDRLHLRATYLPIQIDLSKADIFISNCVTLEAVLMQKGWEIWYQGYWYDRGLDNEIGVTVVTGSPMGVDLSWRKDRDGNTWLKVGFVFRVL